MRIGFDVDGVLANFSDSYKSLMVHTTGRDTFPPEDSKGPACWDWDAAAGYTPEEIKQVWGVITTSPRFWQALSPLEGAQTLALVLPDMQRHHDIYFVTNRPGTPKVQTERWLQRYVGIAVPTVLISKNKGACAAALKLDAYIDDNLPNVLSVLDQSPETRTFLLRRNYNDYPAYPEALRCVNTVGQMLDYLLLDL